LDAGEPVAAALHGLLTDPLRAPVLLERPPGGEVTEPMR
jgi:hypothetical protein